MVTHRTWWRLGARDMFTVMVAGKPAPSVEQEAETAIAAALAEIEAVGFKKHHVVRSRLWAADSDARRLASDKRREMLVGDLRSASASFSDPERLPEGSRMMIEIMAMRPRKSDTMKSVKEYEPPIAPPKFALLDGMLFLSGNTDEFADLQSQLACIRAKIDAALTEAGGAWRQVLAVSAFVSKKPDIEVARQAIVARFPEAEQMLETTTVVGYSAPAKLVEIEVTADISWRAPRR